MVSIVGSDWVRERIGSSKLRILDPRPPMKYLSGHLIGAVNLPLVSIRDQVNGGLAGIDKLSAVLSNSGIELEQEVLIYDSSDGQAACMLAWALEYLGHPRVYVLSSFFEKWVEGGGERFYRPAKTLPAKFAVDLRLELRISSDELLKGLGSFRILDLRSRREFLGEDKTAGRPGRIPGAINLPWTELLGAGQLFKPLQELETMIRILGLQRTEPVVTYCLTGPRACVGYLALNCLGFANVKVYDRSFIEWSTRQELPVEI